MNTNTATEMPQMASAQYISNTITPGQWGTTGNNTGDWIEHSAFELEKLGQAEPDFKQILQTMHDKNSNEMDEEMVDTPTRRLVKIFMADPDENIPLEDCLLYSGKEFLTDLTDEELFFEIPVKELLDKHNIKRVKIKKETASGRKTEYLKKARIRDLRMMVVTIAGF